VFRVERDGFRLSAARTLASDADYRQLSIRRLMTMLELTIDRQAQALVFEPNTAALRRDLTFTIAQLLREMQRRGAFAGATDADSFFVRCDDTLNPRASQELGRLIAEVGVAPAAPLEYLVLRLTQDQTGRVQVAPAGVGGVS
jgi:phage tail sheath protein FI